VSDTVAKHATAARLTAFSGLAQASRRGEIILKFNNWILFFGAKIV
jgi:hypothetical protein